MNWSELNLTIEGLQRHYRRNDFTPAELCDELRRRCTKTQAHNAWIHLLDETELEPYLRALQARTADQLPLYGVPFAIKDNIDLAGVPTTAACAEFAYTPAQHAFVVKCLIDAGAIPLGKTNMDQFATGLSGTRSPAPWGPCRNAFNPDYIAGGSSSGSAVAVALNLAAFALGTDTAGSGRVPAALNNLVGLKPTRGLLSTRGVVPACRSLDCVSIFARSSADAQVVFNVCARRDDADSFNRPNVFANSSHVAGIAPGAPKLGVPRADQLQFFGDDECAALWQRALADWRSLGADIIEIDFEPFLQAARLLYEGPWPAERYLATQSLLSSRPDAMHPVVRGIIEAGARPTAMDVFDARYRLQELKRRADAELSRIDCLLTPTIPAHYRIKQLLADPVGLNSRLGYYTNYMNLLDYSAVAIPAGSTKAGVPWGVTLVAGAFHDQRLLAYAALWQQSQASPVADTHPAPYYRDLHYIEVAVCGAHLAGQPLNWQLTERGGRLLRVSRTAAQYRLYVLPDGRRPALVRLAAGDGRGRQIEIEIWRLPAAEFGGFVALIPPPLGMGQVQTRDGDWLCGFICEHGGIEGATDISEHGGWRAWLAARGN